MSICIRPFAALAVVTVFAVGMSACQQDETVSAPAALFIEALSALDPPSGPGALAPNLALGDGGPLLTWLEPSVSEERNSEEHKEFRLLFSRLGDAGWSAPTEIVSGDDLIAGWADFPALTQSAGGELVGHWLATLEAGGHAMGIQTTRSSDGGSSWQHVGLLHDDTSPTEHGFVSYAPSGDGIRAFWLDGRRMVDGGSTELRTAVLGDEPTPAATVLDDRACECCSTDAAQTSEGPIVVYRDRGDDEVRDVSIVRATADGWSEPRTVHHDGWQIHGCPVNGPAAAADGIRVAVAWFTVTAEEPRVQVAFSADAGATFGSPVVVDGARPLGRVDVALDREGHALVSWVGSVDETKAEIRLARVASSGEIGEVRVIAETTPKRSAGIPRMILDGDRLVIAWTEDGEPSRVRAGVLPVG